MLTYLQQRVMNDLPASSRRHHPELYECGNHRLASFGCALNHATRRQMPQQSARSSVRCVNAAQKTPRFWKQFPHLLFPTTTTTRVHQCQGRARQHNDRSRGCNEVCVHETTKAATHRCGLHL